MAITLPHYLQARNLVSLSISGANPDSSGDLTWGTAVNLAFGGVARFEAFTVDFTESGTQIRTADSTMDSMAPEYDSFSATVQEIAPANGIGTLATMYTTYDYIRVEALYRQRGASDGGVYIVVVGKRGSFSKGIVAGKNVDRLTLEPCGVVPYIGTSEPSI